MAETEEIHRFESGAEWSGDGAGSGTAAVQEGRFSIPIAGATVLGGTGGRANPEELLLAALGACFVNTWAIFLKKLALGWSEPAVRVSCEVGKDPAGGYRLQKAIVHARVPASLLAAQRPQIEKTLGLTEKYCIVSKAVRAAMPLEVVVEGV